MNKFTWIAELLAACGGRRFVMTVGAGFVHTGLVIERIISPEIYRDLTIATVAAYITARTWQHVTESKAPASA